MKTIQFNKQQYSIPESWSEVTIRQQIQAEKFEDSQKHVKTLGVLAAYTGIDIDELKQAETQKLMKVMEYLKFISEPMSTDNLHEFEYKGEKYSVSENLIKQEFQDYVAAQTAIAMYENDKWTQLLYLLAIMAKKGEETLSDYDVNERVQHLMEIDVETCNRVAAFFLSSQRALGLIGMLSSPAAMQQEVQNKVQQLETSLKTLRESRGGNLFIRLWIMIIRKWIRFLNRQSQKYFNSLQSNNSKKSWMPNFKRLLWKKRRKNKGK